MIDSVLVIFHILCSIGYGSDSGWGVSGKMIQKFLEEMAGYLEEALHKFVHVRHEKRLKEAADDVNRLLEKKVQREKRLTTQNGEIDLHQHEIAHDIHADGVDDEHGRMSIISHSGDGHSSLPTSTSAISSSAGDEVSGSKSNSHLAASQEDLGIGDQPTGDDGKTKHNHNNKSRHKHAHSHSHSSADSSNNQSHRGNSNTQEEHDVGMSVRKTHHGLGSISQDSPSHNGTIVGMDSSGISSRPVEQPTPSSRPTSRAGLNESEVDLQSRRKLKTGVSSSASPSTRHATAVDTSPSTRRAPAIGSSPSTRHSTAVDTSPSTRRAPVIGSSPSTRHSTTIDNTPSSRNN